MARREATTAKSAVQASTQQLNTLERERTEAENDKKRVEQEIKDHGESPERQHELGSIQDRINEKERELTEAETKIREERERAEEKQREAGREERTSEESREEAEKHAENVYKR